MNNLYSILKVRENDKVYELKTRKNLTKKLLKNDQIKIEKRFKCLILLVGTGELYMIDIFIFFPITLEK